MKDPVECCQMAGVQAPSNALQHAGSTESSIFTDQIEDINEITVSAVLELAWRRN